MATIMTIHLMLQFEMNLLRYQTKIARSVIAVSHREAKTFLNNGVNNVHVLGHTIKATPGENLFTERKDFLFVGALRDDGSPNVDSLLWFIINALPLIESQIPEAKLYVIGDYSAPSLTLSLIHI